MKIAISGKGGVGKTTVAAGLARLFAEEGRRVIAIDADPDANLASALGAAPAEAEACPPLAEMSDLIEERTGARPGAGGMFRLNPDVSDVIERCGLLVRGVRTLRMGTVERGGSGCMCAESSFLAAFVRHLLTERDDVVIMDMEAGVEHLGRATAAGVDVLVVVVEPGARSVRTAGAIARLAEDIGIRRIVAVANKVASPEDESFIRGSLDGIPLVATIPRSDRLALADRAGESAYDVDETFAVSIRELSDRLSETLTATEAEGPRCW